MGETVYNISHRLNYPVEEAYKVLKANLQFCEPELKIKTLAITSFSPGEGKTTTSVNLSIVMAKSGMKVLYVDADLRKPIVYKTLVNSDFKGLSNYLMGQVELEEIINPTNIKGFYFISCGVRAPNPGELVSDKGFADFLEKVRERYDMIIIDTPPLGSVIDAAVIASNTDGTIIVIKPNTVRQKNALMMKEQLLKANAKIVGVILNKVERVEYKNYYCGYDYYGTGKKHSKRKLKKQFKEKRGSCND